CEKPKRRRAMGAESLSADRRGLVRERLPRRRLRIACCQNRCRLEDHGAAVHVDRVPRWCHIASPCQYRIRNVRASPPSFFLHARGGVLWFQRLCLQLSWLHLHSPSPSCRRMIAGFRSSSTSRMLCSTNFEIVSLRQFPPDQRPYP